MEKLRNIIKDGKLIGDTFNEDYKTGKNEVLVVLSEEDKNKMLSGGYIYKNGQVVMTEEKIKENKLEEFKALVLSSENLTLSHLNFKKSDSPLAMKITETIAETESTAIEKIEHLAYELIEIFGSEEAFLEAVKGFLNIDLFKKDDITEEESQD